MSLTNCQRSVVLGSTCPLLPTRVHHRRPTRRSSRLHVTAALPKQLLLPSSSNEEQKRRGDLQRVAGAVGDYPYNPQPATNYPSYNPQSFGTPDSSSSLGEAARQSLAKATRAMGRYGWIGFWVQLTLSVVSGIILLFSVAFTSQSGPKASLYLTLVGILAGFLSTFWNFGYQRTATRMQEYLDGANVAKVKKQQVMDLITRGILINIVGMGTTLLGISTLVGLLVAKTLGNASINPFLASTAGGYNPVLALDVFLVQAATNTLLGHFLSLICSLWLLNIVGEGRGLRFQRQQHMRRVKGTEVGTGDLISGTVKGFAGVYDIPKAFGGRSAGGSSGGGSSGRSGGGGSDGWRVRAAAAAAAGSGRIGSTGVRPVGVNNSNSSSSSSSSGSVAPPKQGFASSPATAAAVAGGSASVGSSSSSSSSRNTVGSVRVGSRMPVVAAAAVSSDSSTAAAAASQSSSPAAAASIFSSSNGTTSTAAGSDTLLDKISAWRAAARPAAAAAAATAQALAAAGLPAPPIRTPKVPEQRLEQDLLIFPTQDSLQYLNGELPGDQGFDPLNLFHPANNGGLLDRRWLVTSEVIHGRWAMLGALGCLVPEMLGGRPWFQTGWLPPVGSGQYWTDTYTLFAVQLLLMGFAEGCRLQDYRKPGSMAEPLQILLPQGSGLEGGFAGSGSPAYPGGPVFNYFSYVRDLGPAVAQYKESEIRHGRLAMLAMLGFGAQAVITGEGPWANFVAHIESPGSANLFTSFGNAVSGGEGADHQVGSMVAQGVAAVAAAVALLSASLLAA